MNTATRELDDPALEQLYAAARRHPLLTEQQERAADQAKWAALAQVQRLLLRDRRGRALLALWAGQLLACHPSPGDFALREHHYLLRREQSDYLDEGARRQQLRDFLEVVRSGPDRGRDGPAIDALELPAALTAALAEITLDVQPLRGVAAALMAWLEFRAESADPRLLPARATKPVALRRELANYYAARETLVNHNLRLVFSIAAGLRGRGLAYQDLVQDGALGLLRAAEKYRSDRGFRFSTYAYNWIVQAARRDLDDMNGIIRFPTHVAEKIARLYRERMRHWQVHGQEPDLQRLSAALAMEPEEIARLRRMRNLASSLDAPVFDEPDAPPLGDTLSGGPFNDTPADAEQGSLRRCLSARLALLEPAERQVVTQRWGLSHDRPCSREEVARQMRVSTEWVRQLEGSALRKLSLDPTVGEVYRDYRAHRD